MSSPVKVVRMLVACAVVVIAVLSLVPNELRPHVGPKLLEHFVAYLGTGALLALAWPHRSAILLFALPVYSAALELTQMWVPGRTTSFADFAASAFGASIGVLAMWIAQRKLSPSHDRSSSSTKAGDPVNTELSGRTETAVFTGCPLSRA